jgi:EamA domain-containing membrane protein RarD
MSFREKIHWVALIGLALGFGWYFASYPWAVANRRTGMLTSVWMLIPTTIIVLVLAELVRVGAQLYYYRRGH